MKIRSNFVSNSSSSSFIISLDDITAKQLEQIKNHIEVGKELGIEYIDKSDEWDIEIKGNCVLGSTSMNNFDIEEFFRKNSISLLNLSYICFTLC